MLVALLLAAAPFLHAHPASVRADAQGYGLHLPNMLSCAIGGGDAAGPACVPVPVVDLWGGEAGCCAAPALAGDEYTALSYLRAILGSASVRRQGPHDLVVLHPPPQGSRPNLSTGPPALVQS